MLDRESLLVGLILGVLIAGVAGNILQRIRLARLGMSLPNRPMAVRTEGTPRGIIQNASRAARTCLFWALVLILFLVIAGGFVYWLIAGVTR